MDFSSDEYFMREALRQARRALAADEVPIGAVVVREGEIISRAWNQVEMLKDATAHAEMLAAQGVITPEDHAAIARGMAQITQEIESVTPLQPSHETGSWSASA